MSVVVFQRHGDGEITFTAMIGIGTFRFANGSPTHINVPSVRRVHDGLVVRRRLSDVMEQSI